MKELVADEGNPMFHVGDIIQHRNGSKYTILLGVDPMVRMEYCNLPYYTYQSIDGDVIWAHAQTTMEDGRFKKVNQ